MKAPAPRELVERAREWDELHRWERSELGKALRRLGWTYSEIRELIPVPKGTLSYWCREIQLTDKQIAAIKARVPSQKGVPNDSQWRRRLEVEQIQREARRFAHLQMDDPFWVAGTVLYWGEGSKTKRSLELTNSDPVALRLFIAWTRTYHDSEAGFGMALHLHEGNSEDAAKAYWRAELTLPDSRFTKTFVKPRGTGHRKNHLAHGVCRVRMDRSSDAWIRTMEWINVIREYVLRLPFKPPAVNLALGR